MRLLIIGFLLLVIALPIIGQESLGELAPLIGNWKGSAESKNPRGELDFKSEEVKASCYRISKENSVECLTTWTEFNGSCRDQTILFRYYPEEDQYEISYINQRSRKPLVYPLQYDPETKKFIGERSSKSGSEVISQERVIWQISEDGNKISGTHSSHYAGDLKNYWPVHFEFAWQKVE